MFREHHPDNRSLMFLADHQQYHHPSANTALRARVSLKALHSMTVMKKTMGYKKMQVTPVNMLTSLTKTQPLPLWYSTIHSKAPAGDSARTVKKTEDVGYGKHECLKEMRRGDTDAKVGNKACIRDGEGVIFFFVFLWCLERNLKKDLVFMGDLELWSLVPTLPLRFSPVSLVKLV